MSISNSNVYRCFSLRGFIAATYSPFFPGPPPSASRAPPELRFSGFRHISPTHSTTQRLSHRGHLFASPSAALHSDDEDRAYCTLPPRHWKNVGDSRRKGQNRAAAEIGDALRKVVNKEDSPSSKCLYLKRSISNGEVVEHAGTVVILGDVYPGGQVLADGDVIVLGRLQGRVHAGRAEGAVASRVFATNMEPREIQICEIALSCPDHVQTHVPQMAGLSTDGNLRICPVAQEAFGKHCRAGMSREVQIQQPENSAIRGPARVALGTGIYISATGIALLGFPKLFFGVLFDLQGVAMGWVRVGAILAVVFGVYYIGTAVGDMKGMNGAEAFYFSTVVGRSFIFLSFSWLVLVGAVPSPLFLVGILNLVGAMLMLRALLISPAQVVTG